MTRVEPVTREWMEALAAGDDVFASRFGVPVLEGWAGFPEAIPVALDQVRDSGASPWGFHLFFDDDGSLVGYAVAPARQGRGIATAAVRELIERARVAGMRTVVAHTLPERSASTRVLERCGFTHVSDIPDPDGQVGGFVWRWELPLTAG